jgi:hypothetical protein
MYWYDNATGIPHLQEPLDALNQEAMVIDSLMLEKYHEICYWSLSRLRSVCCSASATANLSAIIAGASRNRLEDLVEIALLPDAEVHLGYWRAGGATREVFDDGWTRYYHLFWLHGSLV